MWQFRQTPPDLKAGCLMARLRASGIAVALVAMCSVMSIATHAQDRGEAAASTVVIDASVRTAGPYGETWYLLVTGDGRAFFEYASLRTPMGSVSGKFLVDPAAIRRVQEQAQSTQFSSLPKALEPSPVPMHAPDYRLKVRIGDEVPSVRVYAPKELQDTAALQRFWSVWNMAWSLVPLRPRPP
jgi:hypothetical protein